MRRFLLVGHRAPTSPDFPLEDLPGSAGRLDILVRGVTAAFILADDLRRDVEVTLVLQGPPRPPRTLRFLGDRLRSLNPDERSTAARIRRALEYDGQVEKEVSPGILASGGGLAQALERHAPLFVLRPGGDDVREFAFPPDPAFLLWDDRDLSDEELALVAAAEERAVSAGPALLHADQVITILHNELDRRAADGA